MLPDVLIKKYLRQKKIIIRPAPKAGDFKSVGVKIHLGKDLLLPQGGQLIDLSRDKPPKFKKVQIGRVGYVLKPGVFILGTTKETYQVKRNLAGLIYGRSTLARLGLTIHGTSCVVEGNNDHSGSITLEIKNQGPYKLLLKAGMSVGMLVFFELKAPVNKNQRFHYQGQISTMSPDLKALRD